MQSIRSRGLFRPFPGSTATSSSIRSTRSTSGEVHRPVQTLDPLTNTEIYPSTSSRSRGHQILILIHYHLYRTPYILRYLANETIQLIIRFHLSYHHHHHHPASQDGAIFCRFLAAQPLSPSSSVPEASTTSHNVNDTLARNCHLTPKRRRSSSSAVDGVQLACSKLSTH
jgi:hypothetical protein